MKTIYQARLLTVEGVNPEDSPYELIPVDNSGLVEDERQFVEADTYEKCLQMAINSLCEELEIDENDAPNDSDFIERYGSLVIAEITFNYKSPPELPENDDE